MLPAAGRAPHQGEVAPPLPLHEREDGLAAVRVGRHGVPRAALRAAPRVAVVAAARVEARLRGREARVDELDALLAVEDGQDPHGLLRDLLALLQALERRRARRRRRRGRGGRRRNQVLVLVFEEVPHGLAERHEARPVPRAGAPHLPQLVGA